MRIDSERLRLNFDRVTDISATKTGCTRFSYSKEDMKVRSILIEEMKSFGMEVKHDFAGNIRAVYNPDHLKSKSVLIGSHIDTVMFGGKYDGLTGVLSSIEAVRQIQKNGIKLKHPVEIVIFAEEEGSNFGVTMIGSKFITGKIDESYLKKLHADNGMSAYDIISECGFLPFDADQPRIDSEHEMCMIELHVEQGGILDNQKKKIGIVQAIAGMVTLQVTVEGTSNHAGTTPMSMRRDPVAASAMMIDKISGIPEKLEMDTAVATVGKINVEPNGSNVIASKVVFNVDIRDVIEENIKEIADFIKELCKETAAAKNVNVSIIKLGESNVVHMADRIVNTIEESAKQMNLPYIRMNSGAVHDNAMLNGIIETGMIFVPSIKGISHSYYEDTEFEDIVAGAELLLETVIRLAK